ncbi:MAG: RNA polymerase factor sigma-54 [Sphingorhabdus sp.]
MALAPRLDLRQTQSLVMTPQLQQAIKLLALSSVEIDAFIAEELEKNPLLEIASGEDRGDTEMPGLTDAIPSAESLGSDQLMNDGDFGTGSEALDTDFSNESFEPGEGGGAGADGMLGMTGVGAGGSDFGEGPDFDAFAAPDISLREHLMNQAGASASGRQLLLLEQLIEHIEPSGWLGVDLMALAYRLGVPMAEMEEALGILQSFDPTGIGARDLAECIALQAKEADRYDPCMARLIDNLDLVARGSFDQLMRLCRVDAEDMHDMLAELRSYDPKPGLRFDSDDTAVAVTPDIFVTPQGKGWAIELNSANLPRLLVNRSYYAEMGGGGCDPKSKGAANSWLNEALADANWLIKAMDQRQRTIMKVATELVKQQEGFFREGVSRLKPLTLRQVAEAIDMHESTVSRVTSNKYLHCSRGLFDLKYFFSSGVGSADGDGASAEAVKAAIKTLIDAEAADDILSDDTLVDMLKEKGFDIARRTVAKYREAMGIGSSVQRRRAKKMGR